MDLNVWIHAIHGYGFRCARCGKFNRWSGKGKEKQKQAKLRKAHRQAGEPICQFCGITESEAARMGHHFALDHVEARDFGGEDSVENTRFLCSVCHYFKTAMEHHTRGVRKVLDGCAALEQLARKSS